MGFFKANMGANWIPRSQLIGFAINFVLPTYGYDLSTFAEINQHRREILSQLHYLFIYYVTNLVRLSQFLQRRIGKLPHILLSLIFWVFNSYEGWLIAYSIQPLLLKWTCSLLGALELANTSTRIFHCSISHVDLRVRGLRGAVVNVLDYDIVVSGFKLQSSYDVHFRTSALGKSINPLTSPTMNKKRYHYYTSTRMAMGFNFPQRMICH